MEHIIPVGHWEVSVQTLSHCGTGDGLGDGLGLGEGVGVAIENVRLQSIGDGDASSAACGLLSGTLGATATCLN